MHSLRIAGIEKSSLIDFPGRISCVLFLAGCNWNCYYCHNRSFIRTEGQRQWMTADTALQWLETRRGLLDGVVLCGGEPTLQRGLRSFARALRGMGYKIKLDTNGSRPDILRSVLAEGLADYVAMDVKAPLAKYEAVCGVAVDHRLINESIDLLMHSDVDYEFRTTVLPEFSHSDVLAIARRIRGARRYALQRYRLPRHEDAPSGKPVFTVTHLPDWPEPIMDELQTIVPCVELRGFEIPQSQEAAKPKFALFSRQ